MTTNIAKIRAVLESAKTVAQEFGDFRFEREADEAIAALAKLEKAAAEPVATVCLVTDRFAHNHCIEVQLQVDPCAQLPIGTKLYAAPPAPVAGIREVVYATAEMASRVANSYFGTDTPADMSDMMEVLGYWQRELGQALGFVKLKEPTPEECERICSEYERLLMREGTCGGRDAFDAVRAVMWPKENGK